MSPTEPGDPPNDFAGPWVGAPRDGGEAPSRSSRRRVAALVLGAALLSAVFSSAGTFALISLTRPTAGADVAGRSSGSQLVDLSVSDAIVRVAAAAKSSVVTITAAGASDSGPSATAAPASRSASGFVVGVDGRILTSYHVINGASSLAVVLPDGRSIPATVVKTDAAHDLALIKVSVTGLTPVTLGDSDAVREGQLAIVIGSPLVTFTDSVTQGVVSGTNRTATIGDRLAQTEQNLTGLIQTDAAISPGNSGGPLFDAGGSVVGVITAGIGDAEGVGFAVPINQAKAMISAAGK